MTSFSVVSILYEAGADHRGPKRMYSLLWYQTYNTLGYFYGVLCANNYQGPGL